MSAELPRVRHPVDLAAMRSVVHGNQAELIAWIDRLETDAKFSADIASDRLHSQAWHDELLRRLFNWSSSANALVEHTRAVMAEYPSWKEGFDSRRRDLVDEGLASFVSRLRAVLHHIDTVPLSVARKFDETGAVLRTQLVIERGLLLLTPEDWTKVSRSFIETQEPTFSLRDVIVRYQEQVTALYGWLDRYIEERRRALRNQSTR